MKSYLSLIPISARVHRRQNRMTLLCIIFAVFLVTAIFSTAEMGARMEQTRLAQKHGSMSFQQIFDSTMGQSLLLTAAVLCLLILAAGVLMISGSINSSVAQRTQFFGMMRCIGMSRRQIIRFVRLEALNWCKTAVPIGLILGILCSWGLCAALRFLGGGRIFPHSPFRCQHHRNRKRYCGGRRDGSDRCRCSGEAGLEGASCRCGFRLSGKQQSRASLRLFPCDPD